MLCGLQVGFILPNWPAGGGGHSGTEIKIKSALMYKNVRNVNYSYMHERCTITQ